MENIEQYNNGQIGGGIVPAGNNVNQRSLLLDALKRWRTIIIVFIIVCSFGIPLIWHSVKPYYQATAAIRVAPVISNLLFEGQEGIPMYSSFLYTQAELIASDKVLQKVADELVTSDQKFKPQPEEEAPTENLIRHEKNVDYALQLRSEIAGNNLVIKPEQNTELIKISMKSQDPQKAERITNCFVRVYMAMISSEESEDDSKKLSILEHENDALRQEIDKMRNDLREKGEEYGSESLDSRQSIMLKRVAALQQKITEIEMQKIILQTQTQVPNEPKKIDVMSEDFTRMRYEYMNDDFMVKTLTSKIIDLEGDLITARQHLNPNSLDLAAKIKMLDSMKQKLKERQEEVDKNFSDIIQKELSANQEEHTRDINTQLKQLSIVESQVNELLEKEDANAKEIGRKQLAIQDLQGQLELNEQLYQTVRKKISELELERKRPARVSVAYYANTALFKDNHKKYTLACIFAAVFLGFAVAAAKDKLDVSVRAPSDVTKTADVRCLGTTPRIKGFNKKRLPYQIAEDYQNICANLGLGNGMEMPRRLVISSAAPKEGKTTFSINLATSLTRLGEKVLLIEGDFRKPDIARILKIYKPDDWVRKLFSENDYSNIAYKISSGLYVLTAGTCSEPYAVYRLVKNKLVQNFLTSMGQEYDHIIIDSPPILAVADALFWAQVSDSVILTGFAGQTEKSRLNEAIQRFRQIGINVLGVVLNNVPNNYSYKSYVKVYYSLQTGIRRAVRSDSNRYGLMPPINKK